MDEIYLDYAATTPIDPAVQIAMREAEREYYANASSIHSGGQRSKVRIEKARHDIASALEARAGEIVFTSGGTESNNLALLGAALANRNKGRHIISSGIEHPSVLETCRHLASNGFDVDYVKVNKQGEINLKQLESLLRPETILVSVMMANNETGCISPIKEIGEILRGKDILFHTDAVQAFGKIDIYPQSLNVDLLSLSAHKIYGPKGIGALYMREGIRLQKIYYGGKQEAGRRPGTENIAALVGLAEAVAQITVQKSERKRISTLRDGLENELLNRIPGIKINGHETDRIYSISNIYFPFLAGDSVLMNLDMQGILISTGSACSSGAQSPSHVLNTMGLSEHQVLHSFRISLGRFTTELQISKTVDAIYDIYVKHKERFSNRDL